MNIKLQKTTAIILDDHRMFAETFSVAIEQLHLFKEVLTYTSDTDLIEYFIKWGANREIFLFVDYYLQNKCGLSIIKEVRRLNKKVKIIVVSSLNNYMLINDVLTYKPDAFLSKISGIEDIIKALQDILKNEQYISPYIQEMIQSDKATLSGFTEREVELLQYFSKGFSTEATANILHLSIHTVIAHRRKMMRKAQCHSIVELLAYARNAGLI